jgi:hypothetical protein
MNTLTTWNSKPSHVSFLQWIITHVVTCSSSLRETFLIQKFNLFQLPDISLIISYNPNNSFAYDIQFNSNRIVIHKNKNLTSTRFDPTFQNSITYFSASNVLCSLVFQQLSHESMLSTWRNNQESVKIIKHKIFYLNKNSKQ